MPSAPTPPHTPRRATLPIAETTRGLLVRTLLVRPSDVVFVKSILEASEGVASIFAEKGGELTIAAHASRARDLDELLCDLALEVFGTLGGAAAESRPAERTE